jgi:hypothetical protein
MPPKVKDDAANDSPSTANDAAAANANFMHLLALFLYISLFTSPPFYFIKN